MIFMQFQCIMAYVMLDIQCFVKSCPLYIVLMQWNALRRCAFHSAQKSWNVFPSGDSPTRNHLIWPPLKQPFAKSATCQWLILHVFQQFLISQHNLSLSHPNPSTLIIQNYDATQSVATSTSKFLCAGMSRDYLCSHTNIRWGDHKWEFYFNPNFLAQSNFVEPGSKEVNCF